MRWVALTAARSGPSPRLRSRYHAAMSSVVPASVLVVCYGNLCRSPMAEGLLRARLPGHWKVESAGTHAFGGDEPTAGACAVVLEDFGIDISGQRSAPLTVNSIRQAAHVFAMSVQQARLAAALAPDAAARIRLFGAFAPSVQAVGVGDPGGPAVGPHEVPDPMGGSEEDYRLTAQRLAAAADRAAAWLLAGAEPAQGPPSVAVPGWPQATRV